MNVNLKIFRNFFIIYFTTSVGFKCQRNTVIPKKLSNEVQLSSLKGSYSDFLSLVKPIAIERVSGSSGNVQVRNYIVSQMKSYGWTVDLDSFTADTPYGQKDMANILATYPIGQNFVSPKSTTNLSTLKRIVFACHYDSKYFSNFKFVAATDSAVPCAMLLDMAKFLQENVNVEDFRTLIRHIQFIFFDGEEAFVDWTETDSIYGSRNYADRLYSYYKDEAFATMELFVLLDLLGGDYSSFPNYFPTSSTSNAAYKLMNKIESTLLSTGSLSRNKVYYFPDLSGNGRYNQVADDHKPFLKKNVPILHLIPSPFPSVWHNSRDTLENLYQNNIQDLRLIMKYFLMEILNVNILD